MKFKTSITQPKAKFSIGIEDLSFFIGSCFSQNIGAKFENHNLNNEINPFGTVFNPVSIQNQIEELIAEKYSGENIIEFDDRFISLNHNSFFSNPSKSELISKIKSTQINAKQALNSAQNVFITLGTSWVYVWNENNKIVANCHKIPQTKFKKRLLEIEEIQNSLEQIIYNLLKINKDLNIVFTVSPVRHLKYGFIENSLSKARLIEAVYQIISKKPNTFYFPAYEIFIDDLRDYRFYEDDMVHPSNLGVEYVWQIFKNCFFKESDLEWLKKLENLKKALNHKPMVKLPKQEKIHKEYLSSLQKQIKNKFPTLNI